MSGQKGFLYIEAMIVMVVAAVLGSIAFAKLVPAAKRYVSREEMGRVSAAIQLYEAEVGTTPSTLTALAPVYFDATSGYKYDAWGQLYTWSTLTRQLCSVTVGCMVVP